MNELLREVVFRGVGLALCTGTCCGRVDVHDRGGRETELLEDSLAIVKVEGGEEVVVTVGLGCLGPCFCDRVPRRGELSVDTVRQSRDKHRGALACMERICDEDRGR